MLTRYILKEGSIKEAVVEWQVVESEGQGVRVLVSLPNPTGAFSWGIESKRPKETESRPRTPKSQ